MQRSGKFALAVLFLVLVLFATTGAAASEAERNFLAMYFSDEELEIVSATRSLKSAASVAENVVTVTAAEIELMNAHTVAEALYNVTGIELEDFKGPGSGGEASIHGSGSSRVTVMLDGVPLNNANNGFPLATLPAQMVSKIEVVKGPASSTWGSSFGGVVNVITKSPGVGDRSGGTVSGSAGERGTSDLRAEVHAGKGRFGMYLFGGRMASDGLRFSQEFAHDNLFGKVSVDAGPKTRVDLAGYYHRSDSVYSDYRLLGGDFTTGFALETLHGKADLRTSLADDVELRLSAWGLRNNDNFHEDRVIADARTRDSPIQYDRYGFSGDLAWRAGRHALVAGADWSHERFEREFEPFKDIDQRNYALFVNDTVTAGRLVVTPGLRYDHASLAGGLASPSLGATYLASRDLLFRALVSRGFHDPAIVRYFDAPARGYYASRDLGPEKIWSYQAGVEANVADLLRAKLSLFYHDIDGILVERLLDQRTFTLENQGNARTAGGEFELATNAFRGFVLKAGVHYEDTDLNDFGDPATRDVREVYGVNAAIAYDGKKRFRGTVKAHYVWWGTTDSRIADSRGVVVDLDATRKLLDTGRVSLVLFVGANNLLNAHSYYDVLQRNPDRWVEAGLRAAF